MDMQEFTRAAAALVSQLEGPYRWYVLGAVLTVLTAVMSRVIFKTLKWFLIIAALIIVGLAVIGYVFDQEGSAPTSTAGEADSGTEIGDEAL